MNKIKISSFISAIILSSLSLNAQEMEIFPESHIKETKEYLESDDTSGNLVANARVLRKSNVSTPTITIYRANPSSKIGKTVVVCPGGGYNILAYDLEGTEICQMLNDHGIDAVLLKYRVPRRESREKHEAPLEDLQRAISTVRAGASEYGIAGDMIGIIGFSAGAHLSVMACSSDRSYEPIDDIDKTSARPDFCALIYPAYLVAKDNSISSEIDITKVTAPTFIAQTQDDTAFIDSSLFYYYALKEQKVPVTMHLYPKGGHGYGVRQKGELVDSWSDRLIEWIIAL